MPVLYRGHFAFLRSPRMTASGINTSALFGFANGVAAVLKDCGPDYAVLAMDPDGPTFRHEKYPAYKAQREKMPEDLAAAIPMAFELADALNLPVLRRQGFEADDVMGTIAVRAAEAGLEVLLATPDKDAAQLVTEKIKLFRPGHGKEGPEIYDVEKVKAHWQLDSPRQMIDYLALAGDAADNIPGIRGVGEKTATALLRDWGSVENLVAHASELKGKLAEKVAAGAEDAKLSKFLTAIRTDVPMELDLESLRRREPDAAKLAAVCAKYELAQFARRFGVDVSTVAPSASAAASAVDAAPPSTLADWPHEYTLVTTPAAARRLAAELESAPRFAFDTETTGTDARKARLVGMSFATKPGRAWYVAVNDAPAEDMPEEPDLFSIPPAVAETASGSVGTFCRSEIVDCFARAFADPKKILVAQNAKYDITVLKRYGIVFGSVVHDTMLEHYVFDAAARHGMDHMAQELLNYRPIPIEKLIGEKARGKVQKNMADLRPEEILDYAAEDADVTLRLEDVLRPKCEAAGLLKALETSEEPLVEILCDMEREGVRIDPEALKSFGQVLQKEIDGYVAEIREICREVGCPEPNLDSPKQLGEFLFDKLNLDSAAKRTANGQYATDEKTLQGFADKHPVVRKILEYRACTKLLSTYADKLPGCIDGNDGRVHTTFAQAFTETGRLSSSDPNLQNIPVRSDRGKFIRASIVPREGNVLVSADYSQIELRLMAALSGDESMKQAFAEGADIHRETASKVYGVMPELVTPEQRASCKMVNFGIIYGISAFGLSQRLGIPRREAAQLIDTYFQEYPTIRAFMDRMVAVAREKGYAETILGRRRTLRDIASRNATVRQAAERDAVNTPVQGSAADLMKIAMVRVSRALKAEGLSAKMVLQIHDELLFDTPPEEVERVVALAKREMSSALDFGVPLEVGVGVGKNWLEAH